VVRPHVGSSSPSQALTTLAHRSASSTLQRRSAVDALALMRKALTDWQGLLRQEAPHARQPLSALLAGRLTFTPRGKGRDRHYEFAGSGSLDRVIAGLTLSMELVPPG
jgi:hypothetical protein